MRACESVWVGAFCFVLSTVSFWVIIRPSHYPLSQVKYAGSPLALPMATSACIPLQYAGWEINTSHQPNPGEFWLVAVNICQIHQPLSRWSWNQWKIYCIQTSVLASINELIVTGEIFLIHLQPWQVEQKWSFPSRLVGLHDQQAYPSYFILRSTESICKLFSPFLKVIYKANTSYLLILTSKSWSKHGQHYSFSVLLISCLSSFTVGLGNISAIFFC